MWRETIKQSVVHVESRLVLFCVSECSTPPPPMRHGLCESRCGPFRFFLFSSFKDETTTGDLFDTNERLYQMSVLQPELDVGPKCFWSQFLLPTVRCWLQNKEKPR